MTKGGGTLGRSLLIPFSFMPKKQKPLQKKGFFLWRRERDSSGDTGAVSPPARGTKKPFTGWFFASPCSAVPFSSLSLLCQKKQKSLQTKGFFLWRRERDSSGDTGAVSPPARGTKKPFTGWFFASPCSAVPFSSLYLLCPKSKNPFKRRDFSFGAEKGIRTLVTVPRKHDFQSCALDQLSHLCKPLDYNTPFCVALQAKICIYAAKGFIA